MPGDPGATVVTNARVYYTPRAAAGATGTRHSPRPLSGRKDDARPGRVAPRECGGVFPVVPAFSKPSSSLRKQGPIRRGLSLRHNVGRLRQ